jgi:hypothetical protein
MFAGLLAHEEGKGGYAIEGRERKCAPFKQAGLQAFGDGFAGLHAENPVMARPIEVVVGISIAFRRYDAGSVGLCDAPGSVSRVMVDDQDFGAGEKHFEGSAEA